MLGEAVAQEVSGDVGFFYVDKKRAENVFKLARVQYPRKLDSLNSNGNIHTIDEKVNRKIDSVLKSQQFIRWFGDWQNYPETASKIVNADGNRRLCITAHRISLPSLTRRKQGHQDIRAEAFISHTAPYFRRATTDDVSWWIF